MTDEPPPPPLPPPSADDGWDAPSTAPPAETSGTIIVDDDALPVSTGSDDELRAAAGIPAAMPTATATAKKKPRAVSDHDDAPHRKSNHRVALVAGLFLIAALAIGAAVLLGHLNADRYLIACAPDEIRAERGRAFPPWGARELTGAEYKAIAIPADAECKPRETDSEDELAAWFLELLAERAEKSLLARDPVQAEVAAAQLQQALLLARAPERRDQRRAVERLLGDVDYWRASGKLAAARATLLDAAKQFDAAAAQVPRHVTDAAAWATYVRRVVEDLQAGPGGVHAGPAGAGSDRERPAVPAGVALPIEPAAGSALPVPSPDAGVPAGGVLL